MESLPLIQVIVNCFLSKALCVLFLNHSFGFGIDFCGHFVVIRVAPIPQSIKDSKTTTQGFVVPLTKLLGNTK